MARRLTFVAYSRPLRAVRMAGSQTSIATVRKVFDNWRRGVELMTGIVKPFLLEPLGRFYK